MKLRAWDRSFIGVGLWGGLGSPAACFGAVGLLAVLPLTYVAGSSREPAVLIGAVVSVLVAAAIGAVAGRARQRWLGGGQIAAVLVTEALLACAVGIAATCDLAEPLPMQRAPLGALAALPILGLLQLLLLLERRAAGARPGSVLARSYHASPRVVAGVAVTLACSAVAANRLYTYDGFFDYLWVQLHADALVDGSGWLLLAAAAALLTLGVVVRDGLAIAATLVSWRRARGLARRDAGSPLSLPDQRFVDLGIGDVERVRMARDKGDPYRVVERPMTVLRGEPGAAARILAGALLINLLALLAVPAAALVAGAHDQGPFPPGWWSSSRFRPLSPSYDIEPRCTDQ